MESSNHFTVLIPTFNRASYLYYTLKSCENVTYQNVRFIVLDDCSKDDTAELVSRFAERDTRFELSVARENIGMRRNFERGLEFVKEWFMFLGGDDGLFPNIFDDLNDVITDGNHTLVTWPTCSYYYQDVNDKIGQLIYPYTSLRSRVITSSEFYRKQIKNLYYVIDPEIPMLYVKGVAHISLARKYMQRTESSEFFTQPTPDGFSAFALLSVADQYYFYRDCLSIHGVSPTSMGLAHLVRGNSVQKKLSEQFFDSAKNDRMSKFLGSAEYSVLISVMTADYLKAVRQSNPNESNSCVDDLQIEHVIRKAFKELRDGKYGDTAREREFDILRKICNAHGIGDLFSRLRFVHRVNKRHILSGDALSLKRVYLDASRLNLKNINEAISYVTSIKGNKVLEMYKSALSFQSILKSMTYLLRSYTYKPKD